MWITHVCSEMQGCFTVCMLQKAVVMPHWIQFDCVILVKEMSGHQHYMKQFHTFFSLHNNLPGLQTFIEIVRKKILKLIKCHYISVKCNN